MVKTQKTVKTRKISEHQMCVKALLQIQKDEEIPKDVKTYGQALKSWGSKLKDANTSCSK